MIKNGDLFKTFRAVLLCSTCDLPAKAMMINFTQFNGFYWCSRCLQEGLHVLMHVLYMYFYIIFRRDLSHWSPKLYSFVSLYRSQSIRSSENTWGNMHTDGKCKLNRKSSKMQIFCTYTLEHLMVKISLSYELSYF